MTNSLQQNYSSWHILIGVDRCFVPYMLEPTEAAAEAAAAGGGGVYEQTPTDRQRLSFP